MRSIRLLPLLLILSVSVAAQQPSIIGLDPAEGFTFGVTRVRIHGSGFTTQTTACIPATPDSSEQRNCPVSVMVGGVEAGVFFVTPTTIDAFVYPSDDLSPRAPGLVDVEVSNASGSTIAADAFRFQAFPDTGNENYTTFLVPFTGEEVPGANGSRWTGEFTVYNSSPFPLLMRGAVDNPAIPAPIDPFGSAVEPFATEKVMLHKHPLLPIPGAFVHIPTPLVEEAKMSLRVRDLSRTATSWGAAVPLVRFEDTKSHVTLIDVPTDARYRATLRVYHWSQENGLPSRVRIFRPDHPQAIAEFDLMSTGPGVFAEFSKHPSVSSLDLLTPAVRAAAGDTIRVEIESFSAITSPPMPRIWAMVSITNNDTQQVTVITPQ